MLDRESRDLFSEREWREVQERREADAPIPPIVSVGVENASARSAPFTSDVVLEHADGNRQVVSEVEVVREGGEIKRHLKPDEREYLMNLGLVGEDDLPSLAVEDTIRNHYRAIGTGDFETSYSYFGPTMRTISPEDRWIEDEESYEIERATVDSVEVTAVGERSATAEVRVRFEDNTGAPSFFLRWTLVTEGDEWKLDRVEEV